MKTIPTATHETRPESFEINRSIVAAALSICLMSAGPGIGETATLEPAELESNEGYYQLRWQADEPIRLVESPNPDFGAFDIVYAGSDTGHVASGKPDGKLYYRLESADGARVISNTAVITVRHHSLVRAFSFFALGAVVFVATLGLIVSAKGAKDELA